MKSKIYIGQSKFHGKGVFAKEDIAKGEYIDSFRGKIVKKDAMHVLWLDDEKGILVENDIKYANHDWQNPNSKIKKTSLYALRDIKKDEEILWDYHTGYVFEQDIDLNKPLYDNNGYTVLHCAVMYDNEEVFRNCLKTIRKENLDIGSLESYIDDNNEFKGNILNFIALYGRLNLLKIYLEEKFPIDLKTSDYNYNILHSAFYYSETKIIKFLLSELGNIELENLMLTKSEYNEKPIDFLFIEREKDYKSIIKTIFRKVYKDRSVSLNSLEIYHERYDNYFLPDYLLDNYYFELFKTLFSYSKIRAINYLFRLDRNKRKKYLDLFLSDIKFNKKDLKELENLRKNWPRLTTKLINKISNKKA